MSQFNFGTIDPNVKTGTELAADLNQWRDALHTTHAGVARPAYATPGLLWVDQTNGADWLLKMSTSTGDVIINGINPTTNQRSPTLFPDGSVTAPAIAFASEPGLGWYRRSAGNISMAAGGKKAHDFAASAASSSLTITPLAAGDSVVRLDSDQSDQTNRNVLMLYVNAAEAALLSTTGGAGTARAITYTAPSHNFSGPIVGNGTITTTGGFGLVPGAKPALRFESSGWRLEFDVGYLTYRTWDNASPFSCDPNGNFSIGGMGYKPGGGPWTDSSDGRIKDNIADYTSGLDAVLALRPVSYTFKAETGRDTAIKYVGLIGQEAERAMPEIVTTKADKVGDLEFSDMRTLDSGPLVYALVNAVKELAERVGKLEGA